MSDFIAGKIKKTDGNGNLFNKPKVENSTKCAFSSPKRRRYLMQGKNFGNSIMLKKTST